MKTYRVMHRETKDERTVDAKSAAEACQAMGWMPGECYIREVRKDITGVLAKTALFQNHSQPAQDFVAMYEKMLETGTDCEGRHLSDKEMAVIRNKTLPYFRQCARTGRWNR